MTAEGKAAGTPVVEGAAQLPKPAPQSIRHSKPAGGLLCFYERNHLQLNPEWKLKTG